MFSFHMVDGKVMFKEIPLIDIRLENPFISEDANLQNTIQKSNLFAGIRGSLSSKFTFNLSLSLENLIVCIFSHQIIFLLLEINFK